MKAVLRRTHGEEVAAPHEIFERGRLTLDFDTYEAFLERVHAEDRNAVREAVRQALEKRTSFTLSTLRAGTHTVRATATDAAGHTGQAAVALRVRGPNQPPVVAVAAPPADFAVPAGTPLTLTASAFDDFDGDVSSRIRWSSSIDSSLGLGPQLVVHLSTGRHSIGAVATDSDGATGFAAIAVTVTPTPPAGTASSGSSKQSG